MMKALKSRGGLTHGCGMTESVRTTWVKTMHLCAAVHGTLNCLTNLEQSISDVKHSELEKSRISRDCKDLSAVIRWFTSNNPFDCSDTRLLCLSSGVVADDMDGVNCDTAESVGEKILLKMLKYVFVTYNNSA